MANKVLLVALCSIALVAISFAEEEEKYTDKYDSIDIDEVLANDRLRNSYYNCFMGTGPCQTEVAKFFKEKFPEALATLCKKCTDRQKDAFDKIAAYYTEKEPEKWTQVVTDTINNFKNKKTE